MIMDLTARLIELVRENEILYNSYHPNKNKVAVAAAWTTIAKELGMGVKQVKTRWSSIRTTYGKKKKNAMNHPSEAAATANDRWAYFQMCQFLNSYIKHKDNVFQVNSTDTPSLKQEDSNDVLSDDEDILLSNAESLEIQCEASETAMQDTTVIREATISSASTSPPTDPTQLVIHQGGSIVIYQDNGQKLKFLEKSADHMSPPKLDKYDHFASFVAMQLRSNQGNTDIMMKKIMDIIMPGLQQQAV